VKNTRNGKLHGRYIYTPFGAAFLSGDSDLRKENEIYKNVEICTPGAIRIKWELVAYTPANIASGLAGLPAPASGPSPCPTCQETPPSRYKDCAAVPNRFADDIGLENQAMLQEPVKARLVDLLYDARTKPLTEERKSNLLETVRACKATALAVGAFTSAEFEEKISTLAATPVTNPRVKPTKPGSESGGRKGERAD
jgi:hypothetical protein